MSPKARKKNPPASQTSNYVEPKRKLTTREKTIKTGAILIVVALVMSLLAGALSFSPTTPAVAAEMKSVQLTQGAAKPAQGTQKLPQETPKLIDTDGDGLENNADQDVDGDGIVNGEDSDIDGDGLENFDDADPIGVLGIDSNGPIKPIRPAGSEDSLTAESSLVWLAIAGIGSILIALGLAAKNARKRRK